MVRPFSRLCLKNIGFPDWLLKISNQSGLSEIVHRTPTSKSLLVIVNKSCFYIREMYHVVCKAAEALNVHGGKFSVCLTLQLCEEDDVCSMRQ